MFEMFSYKFMQTAFLAGTLVALLCSTLGMYIVLRRLSFLADGIAHISLAGIAAAIVTGMNIVVVTLLVALAGALGINKLREERGVPADAAIGIMLPVGLALGIVLLSFSHVTSVDLVSYLFGSILAITESDLLLIAVFGFIVLLATLLMRRQWLYIAFDEESARASGIPVSALNYAFFALSGVAIVLALRVAGVLLVSALMIIPPSTALQFKLGYKKTLVLSAFIAVVSVWVGITASYYTGVATGAAIALTSFALFMLAPLLSKKK